HWRLIVVTTFIGKCFERHLRVGGGYHVVRINQTSSPSLAEGANLHAKHANIASIDTRLDEIHRTWSKLYPDFSATAAATDVRQRETGKYLRLLTQEAAVLSSQRQAILDRENPTVAPEPVSTPTASELAEINGRLFVG